MALPTAAIVCIVLACWVLVVLVAFAVYQFLKSRGNCSCDCAPCGKEERQGCCECCISLSNSCDCCNPSVNGCLDKLCPGKKKVSCVDLILCQCCAGEGEQSCCLKILPSCKCCDLTCCDSECCSSCADCEAVVCCCLEIRLVSKSEPTNNKLNKTSGKYIQDKPKALMRENVKKPTKKDKDNELPERETVRPLPVSPPTSARSVSQLILVPKLELRSEKGVRKHVKRRAKAGSTDQSKVSGSIKNTCDTHSKKKVTKRSLPDTPSSSTPSSGPTLQKSILKTNARGSTGSDSELEEVAIQHQNIPLHTLSSNHVVRALSLGSLQSGSHVTFSLSEMVNSQGFSGGDHSVHNVNNSLTSSYSEVNTGGTSLQTTESPFQHSPASLDHWGQFGHPQHSNTSVLVKRPLPLPTAR